MMQNSDLLSEPKPMFACLDKVERTVALHVSPGVAWWNIYLVFGHEIYS
jgi:hypothetical protein